MLASRTVRRFARLLTSTCPLLLTVVLVAPADAARKTFVPRGDPDDAPVYRPHHFVAGSGVGGGVLRLSNVTWSAWGRKTAIGHGTFTSNLCDPTCAAGKLTSVSARIRLYRPRLGCRIYQGGKTTTARVPIFTRIELKYGGHTFKSLTSGTQSCQ